MATIEQLAYKIVADTSGFTQGVMATRTELRASRAITDQVMTANERLGKSIDGVEALYAKGTITLETRNRALSQLRDSAAKAAAAENKLGDAARHGGAAQAGLLQSHLSSLPIVRDVNTSFMALPGPILAAAAALTVVKLGFDAVAGAGQWVVSTVAEQTGKILQLSRESEALGVSSAALAGWRDAASDLSGAADGQLDSALVKMNKNIAEAVHGSEEAAASLEALGLSGEDLAAGGTEAAFYAITDAIAAIENPMERTRMSMAVFGKGGAELLNTFAAGSAGLKDSVAGAEEIGLALSELDVSRVAEMGLAVDQLGDISEGFANQITAAVAPSVAAFAQGLASATEEGQPLRAVMDDAVVVVKILAENMGGVADVGAVMFGAAILSANVVLVQMDAVAQGIAALDRMAASIKGGVNEDLQRGTARLHELTIGVRDVGVHLAGVGMRGEFTKGFADARAEIESAEPKARQLGGAMLEIADAGEKAGKKTAEAAAKAKDWGAAAAQIHNELRTPVEKYQDRIGELNQAVTEGGLAWEDYERGVAKAAEELDRLSAAKKSAADHAPIAAATRDSQAATDASAKAIAAQTKALDADKRRASDRAQVALLTRDSQAAIDAGTQGPKTKAAETQRAAVAAEMTAPAKPPGGDNELVLQSQLATQQRSEAHLLRIADGVGRRLEIKEVSLS